MTVRDLIDYLNKLPKDTVIGVVYQCCSDLVILEEGDMHFTDKLQMDQRRFPCGRYVLRHGKIMVYNENTWDKEEVPHFVPVLVLPGN